MDNGAEKGGLTEHLWEVERAAMTMLEHTERRNLTSFRGLLQATDRALRTFLATLGSPDDPGEGKDPDPNPPAA